MDTGAFAPKIPHEEPSFSLLSDGESEGEIPSDSDFTKVGEDSSFSVSFSSVGMASVGDTSVT